MFYNNQCQGKRFLSTLSLRRATFTVKRIGNQSRDFYPRSPCGERRIMPKVIYILLVFLSTLSLRRATFTCARWLKVVYNFYPRSPCGERLSITITITCTASFLSTLSLRRATLLQGMNPSQIMISIHALLAESDPTSAWRVTQGFHFYPRSPCGERQTLTDKIST